MKKILVTRKLLKECEEKALKMFDANLNSNYELYSQNVLLEGMVLKPNMVLSGYACSEQASVDEVAEMTVTVLKRCVPSAVPGIAFLSGGQSRELATAHLSKMNEQFL